MQIGKKTKFIKIKNPEPYLAFFQVSLEWCFYQRK